MRRLAIIARAHFVLITLPVCAQIPADPVSPDGKVILDAVKEGWTAPITLNCRVTPFPPERNYSFRIASGFRAVLPVTQFPERSWNMIEVFKVTSRQNREPAYFWDRFSLPEPSKRRRTDSVSLGGGFYLGPGDYTVQWLLVDDTGRVCRQEWKMEAKGRASQYALKPGAVEAVGLDAWRGPKAKTAEPGRSVTVFLHAAPVSRRRNFVQLSNLDRGMLLRSLTALLDVGRFNEVRLVAYDALGKRVLFRSDTFDQGAYRRLSQTLREANFATVDYKVLTEGPPEEKILSSMLSDEGKREKPSDAIVFLGPELQRARRVPPDLAAMAERFPKTYYLAISREPVQRGDLIQKLVKSANGRVNIIQRTQDLLKPLRVIAADR